LLPSSFKVHVIHAKVVPNPRAITVLVIMIVLTTIGSMPIVHDPITAATTVDVSYILRGTVGRNDQTIVEQEFVGFVTRLEEVCPQKCESLVKKATPDFSSSPRTTQCDQSGKHKNEMLVRHHESSSADVQFVTNEVRCKEKVKLARYTPRWRLEGGGGKEV
jgi:hypothetical protein